MKEHTPTPWKVVHGSSIRGSDCKNVANTMGALNWGPDCVRGNVAFIVRACNAHDELVAALEGLVKVARMYHKGEAPGHADACDNPDNCGHCLAMREVNVALAKATE